MRGRAGRNLWREERRQGGVARDWGEGKHQTPTWLLNPHQALNSNLHPILSSRVDLTFLIAVGCTVGIIATMWVLYRSYRLLFITYCTAVSR